MRVLLDTQALLWYSAGDSRLSDRARAVIEDGNNDRLVSIAGLWEIAIKCSVGKLNLADPFDQFVQQAIKEVRCDVLDISIEHLVRMTLLPFHHRDPFDRVMIAQSQIERVDVVSIDGAWDAYGVKRHW